MIAWKERMKDGRHVGLDFYDLLIEAILPNNAIERTDMNALVVAPKATDWHRLKRLVLDSVSSPITRRVYNLGLDEFFEWYGREPRAGFTTYDTKALKELGINK